MRVPPRGVRNWDAGNGLSLSLLEGGEIGAVEFGGLPLRDPARPLSPEIRTPDGVGLTNLRLVGERTEGDALVLGIEGDRHQTGLMEWMLHTVRNRYAATDWTDVPVPAEGTRLELVLRPVARVFGDETWHGFSYAYRYRSADLPIYKIFDRATWEPGGSIVGSEFWMRNGVVPSVRGFGDLGERYSTEWYLPLIEQPNIFQFFPLQMALQGFTFTASPHGTLVTWPTRPAHVRSLFEKHAGKGALFHWHEHCADLGHELDTAEMEVLWAPGDPGRTGTFDRWEAVRETVWTHLHDAIGMRQEEIAPYGVIEEWTLPDLAMYRDVAAPALLAAGARTIFLPNEFQNNMNVFGVSNMCCNVDYQLPDTLDHDAFRGLCANVREAGGKVEMWGNTALSTLADMFSRKDGPLGRVDFLPEEGSVMEAVKRAKHPWVRNPSGAIEADHYTPVFCALNLRDPVIRDYWMRRWTELHERIGVDQVFVDSSFNMSADKFTHRQNDAREQDGGATLDQSDRLGTARPARTPPQAIESQYLAYLELMVEMQRAGYVICGEDTGLFGLSRSGPDLAMRLEALPLWCDSYCDFDPEQARAAGREPDDVFFEGLAFRTMWKIYFDVPTREVTFRLGGARSEADRPTPWHAQALATYARARKFGGRRRLIPDHGGVRYDGPSGTLVWAFRPLSLVFGSPTSVSDLASEERVSTDHFTVPPRAVRAVPPGTKMEILLDKSENPC